MSRFDVGLKNLAQVAGKPAPATTKEQDTRRTEDAGPPPSRVGKVAISGYFAPSVRKQLAIMAVRQDRSQVDLMAEALNLLFERHGEAPIASVSTSNEANR